jgi:nucleotide-binding universal stress UspA family protein
MRILLAIDGSDLSEAATREVEERSCPAGSHGRTGWKRWILGSMAEAVFRHAPYSVEVVRDRAAARE